MSDGVGEAVEHEPAESLLLGSILTDDGTGLSSAIRLAALEDLASRASSAPPIAEQVSLYPQSGGSAAGTLPAGGASNVAAGLYSPSASNRSGLYDAWGVASGSPGSTASGPIVSSTGVNVSLASPVASPVRATGSGVLEVTPNAAAATATTPARSASPLWPSSPSRTGGVGVANSPASLALAEEHGNDVGVLDATLEDGDLRPPTVLVAPTTAGGTARSMESQAAFEAAVLAAGGSSTPGPAPGANLAPGRTKSAVDRIQADFPRTPSPVYGLGRPAGTPLLEDDAAQNPAASGPGPWGLEDLKLRAANGDFDASLQLLRLDDGSGPLAPPASASAPPVMAGVDVFNPPNASAATLPAQQHPQQQMQHQQTHPQQHQQHQQQQQQQQQQMYHHPHQQQPQQQHQMYQQAPPPADQHNMYQQQMPPAADPRFMYMDPRAAYYSQAYGQPPPQPANRYGQAQGPMPGPPNPYGQMPPVGPGGMMPPMAPPYGMDPRFASDPRAYTADPRYAPMGAPPPMPMGSYDPRMMHGAGTAGRDEYYAQDMYAQGQYAPPPGMAAHTMPPHMGGAMPSRDDYYRQDGGRDRGGRGGPGRGGPGRGDRRDKYDGAGRGGADGAGMYEAPPAVPRSSLLEDFRLNGKTRRWELEELVGHVVEFSKDQHGSRFIQQRLEVSSDADKYMVFNELLPDCHSLMTDVFGNYVIQKFFDHGTKDMRRQLGEQLRTRVLQLALQMYGCRVIQKALEVVDAELQTALVNELEDHVLQCVKDQNGNHVIQKCIELISWKQSDGVGECGMTAEQVQFIVDSFSGQVFSLATHPYGCRVIQRVLEHCAEEQTDPILREIKRCCDALVQDQYGNYVVQHVLEHGAQPDRAELVARMCANVIQFSQHKFASNVIEKCLTFASAEHRRDLIDSMLAVGEDDIPALCIMMRDPYANYVVQKSIDVAEPHQRDQLVLLIRGQAGQLKRFTYGKHILSRLEKITGQKMMQ